MRFAGLHVGTGEEPGNDLLDLLHPDAPTVVNEPEARHWWTYLADHRTGLTIWRASPSVRPADVGWNAHAFSREVFRSLDEHHDRFGRYPTDVLLLNELNLDYERGESQGAAWDTDPANWPGLYTRLARFLSELLDHCRERAARRENFRPRWWYQGWAPGHGEQTSEIAALWVPGAQAFDGIVMHAYHDRETITNDALWYLRTFLDHPVVLGEWNTINLGGNWRAASKAERARLLELRLEEERRILARLASICRAYPRFQALYFIHRWLEDNSHEHDVAGNPGRRALWQTVASIEADGWMPVDPIPSPEPEPIPMPTEPTVAEYQAFARPKLEAAGFDWETYRRQIQQESGWRHLAADGTVLTSYTGTSKGIGQLNQNFYPPQVWQDAWVNLSKSIELMVGYLRRFGSYRQALAAYNWGPGNVGGYTKPDGTVVPPWDGRRETISAQGAHYLDVILGPGWPEPGAAPPTSGVVYEDLRTPHVVGEFSRPPKGVILHGSRSGKAGNPKDKEYRGTANWAVSNPGGLGWHATIGERMVAVHMSPREWGWSARAASDDYLAVELAQATVDEPITDGQVEALSDWIRTRVLPIWPGLPMVFPSHAELDGTAEYGGTVDGKSDVFPRGDGRMTDLRARLLDRLGATGGNEVTREEAEALRAENARLQEQVHGFVNALAYLGDTQADAIQQAVNELRRVREQFVGARPG